MDTVLDTHQDYKILVNFSKLYLKETKMQRNVRFYKDLLKSTKGVQVPVSPHHSPLSSVFIGLLFLVACRVAFSSHYNHRFTTINLVV